MKSKRDEFYQRKKKEKEGRDVKQCICAGCSNRTSDWDVYKQQTFISHNSGGWNSRLGPEWLNEGSLPGCRFHAVSSCGKRGKGLLGSSFIRALITFMAPSSWLKHLPNTSPPYAITLGGQNFNVWILGGTIQTIAGRIQRDPQRKRSRSMFLDLQVIS